MSLGKISGPLLSQNLLRDTDLAFETDLLYIGHSDGKIGINTVSRPRDLTVDGTLRARSADADLTVTQTLNIGDLTFGPDGVSTLSGNINLNHGGDQIRTAGIRTATVEINDNYVGSWVTNGDITFIPNGTGTNEIITANKTVEVDGNVHATGNITFDGNILIGGDDDTDNVRFLADLDGDLIPDTTATYNMGATAKRFNYNTENLTVDNVISAENVSIDGIEITLSQGNIWYVAVNGDNLKRGTNPQGPLGTIKYALSRAQSGDTIFINSGDYEEEFPLVVPQGVSIKGQDIRGVNIRPTTDNQSEDCFLLNGETTVENVTVKDFYYDSVNDKGYAFRFANNMRVTTRSPYVKNITVITKGSATSASDPRGFDSADAGRGGVFDGSVCDHETNEASILFHSVTFITPGVDAIILKNGVRCEWLNSFTYFANRSYHLQNGAGRWRSDSTLVKGAELRSIGSASVYGNYGIVADGDECLAYLIAHNFAYIGVGKDGSNDNTLRIEANEVVELNSGNVYFQSQDQRGTFKVGNNFFVDLVNGSTSIDAETVSASGYSSLSVSKQDETTFIDGETIEIGALRIIAPNTITSVAGPINFVSPSNTHNLLTNTRMKKLSLDGDLTLGGSLITLGNEASDTVDFTTSFAQNLNANTTDTYNLGNISKRWQNTYANEMNIDSFTFNENYIQTNNTNENLELRASGTANVAFDDILAKQSTISTYTTNDIVFNPTVNLNMSANESVVLPVGNSSQRKDNVGDLRYNTQLNIFEGYSGGNVSFPGVYDTDRDTYFDLSNNQFVFVTGGNRNTTLNGQILETNRFDSNDTMSIDGNTITSATVNADVFFRSNGLGSIGQEDLVFKNSTITNTLDTPFTFQLADIYSFLKFNQSKGLVVPYGDDASRPSSPEIGHTRFNTESDKLFLETYNGTQWVLAAGGGESVTEEYAENVNFIWNLILA